jgi:hypothetical protein
MMRHLKKWLISHRRDSSARQTYPVENEFSGRPEVLEDRAHRFGFQVGATNLPRREWHNLLDAKHTSLDQTTDRGVADAGVTCSSVQGHHVVIIRSTTVADDSLSLTRRAHAALAPTLTGARAPPELVEEARDLVVTVTSSHPSDDVEVLCVSLPLRGGDGSLHLKGRMDATPPVDDERQRSRRLLVGDDLGNDGADDALLDFRRASLVVPDREKALPELME